MQCGLSELRGRGALDYGSLVPPVAPTPGSGSRTIDQIHDVLHRPHDAEAAGMIRTRLPDAIKDLNRGNARAILGVSQPLVPVDTGDLKRSGRVDPAPNGASVLIYGGGKIDYAG